MKFCHFHKWYFVDLSDQFRLDIQSDKVVGVQSVPLKYQKEKEKQQNYREKKRNLSRKLSIKRPK